MVNYVSYVKYHQYNRQPLIHVLYCFLKTKYLKVNTVFEITYMYIKHLHIKQTLKSHKVVKNSYILNCLAYPQIFI